MPSPRNRNEMVANDYDILNGDLPPGYVNPETWHPGAGQEEERGQVSETDQTSVRGFLANQDNDATRKKAATDALSKLVLLVNDYIPILIFSGKNA